MSTASYKIDFDELKRTVSMEQVIAYLGLPRLKQRSPKQWKGACPFCNGVDCFVVTSDGGRDKTGAFNCFKCPAGGDQIELASLVRGNPRKDPNGAYAAAKELYEKLCAAGEALTRSNASPQPRRERRSGFDAEAYAKSLDPGHEALTGLGVDAETLRAWSAGYANSGVNRGRLALPVATKDGTIVGYMGRTVKDDTPLLTFPNGLDPQEHIFGVDKVGSGQLFLVRDPLDVLKAFEAGCGNTVCFLTEDIKSIQLECLAALMDERQCESLSFF
ncbi:hypothetical protein LG047_14110 [Methylocystis sp. WRRC1]|uniref:hypothetical protein n=1 Tax=Methylocystis sp. WRRC1 TaxID=1732014 RepID=UPI001D15406F|nr:hypothetical protein [Methylocystis sp. WRRC1]MCC3246438.1 hypothetical protein [Methylocystis sp. WRRC1]